MRSCNPPPIVLYLPRRFTAIYRPLTASEPIVVSTYIRSLPRKFIDYLRGSVNTYLREFITNPRVRLMFFNVITVLVLVVIAVLQGSIRWCG